MKGTFGAEATGTVEGSLATESTGQVTVRIGIVRDSNVTLKASSQVTLATHTVAVTHDADSGDDTATVVGGSNDTRDSGWFVAFFPCCGDSIVATLSFPSFCISALFPPISEDGSAFGGIAAVPARMTGRQAKAAGRDRAAPKKAA